MSADELKTQKTFWAFPWGHSQSLAAAAALAATGVLIQLVTDSYCPLLKYPFNIAALLLFVSAITTLHLAAGKSSLLRWLSSIPAAVASIVVLGILALGMGLLPQQVGFSPRHVFSNISNSWPYFLAVLFLLLTLGMTVLKRLVPFEVKNIGFLFNHLGLWIALAAASFGAGDVRRLIVEAKLGQTVSLAQDERGQTVAPGIAIELKRFDIEYFSPAIVLYDLKTNQAVKNVEPAYLDWPKREYSLNKTKIQVKSYLPEAVSIGEGFQPFHGPGAVPAALLSVEQDGELYEGWTNPPNKLHNGSGVVLPGERLLALSHPQPKRFISEIKVNTREGQTVEASVEVNKPLRLGPWRIYQLSYDTELGRWSEISVLELNRDPWLPVVYAGLIMMIAGALYMFWRGAGNRERSL